MRHLDSTHVRHAVRSISPRPAPRLILLVDPWWALWPANSRTIVELVEARLDVTATVDGRAAIATARRQQPAVVLLDVTTGARGGPQAIHVAGALLDLEPAPAIVFMTGSPNITADEVIRLDYRELPVVPKHESALVVARVLAELDGRAVPES